MTEYMKILPKARILVTRFPYESQFGGEELHTLRLMEELDDHGHEAFFLGSCRILLKEFKARGFSAKKAWLARPPVTKLWLLCFTILSPFLFFKAGWMLASAKRRFEIDTVYMLSFGEKLLMTPWARFFKMRVIWLEHARIGNWLSKNPWRVVYRFFSRWATTVATSRAMLKWVEPFAKKTIAIPCAVMLEEAKPLPAEIMHFLKGGFLLGSVARLTQDKGVDILVQLVDTKPDVKLILVGEGPLKSLVEKHAKNGRILLIPSLPRGQLKSLYKALNLFVLGSTEIDPFGMVAAEAMSVATPVLMTTVCGIAENLTNGREAWIVEPKRSELDKAIKKAIKHPEQLSALGKAGQAYVQKHYRLETMVARFEALINSKS